MTSIHRDYRVPLEKAYLPLDINILGQIICLLPTCRIYYLCEEDDN